MLRRFVLLILTFVISVNVAFALKVTEPMDKASIEERIAPVGKVTVDEAEVVATAANGSADLAPGEKVYNQFCMACHATGLAGSPRLGDKAAWAPRIKQGLETLVKHAIKGIRAMPPKGTCATCSDDDIHETVEFMVSKVK